MSRRGGDKYQAILEAAIRVMAEYGYHNTQVARIAREAGVAEGTIYLYFKNKEDLLLSIFREKMAEFTARVRAELAGQPDPLAKLAALVRTHLLCLENDRHVARVVQVELRTDPAVREHVLEVLRGYFELIEGVVADGIRQGIFAPDVNVRAARKVIFGALDEVSSSWVLSRRQYRLTELAEPVLRLLVRGL
ncbi:MAG: TetR/AcrR family transcriptional regulator, partial [Firmicutes bacterium]|nr:TetR/AcrR family transcriptional regulator [Bacillota bacterium]